MNAAEEDGQRSAGGERVEVGEGPADHHPIATLREGQEVVGVFACTRKERQLSRAGAPYLTVELRDRTGSILARAFRDADLLAGRFERGDLVRAHGRVERFRDQLQIALQTIARAEDAAADPTGFLPSSRRDLDELEGFFEHLARELYEPGLRTLLERVLGDGELRRELRRAPCSLPAAARAGAGARGGVGSHHAYLGGLLEHAVAVATLVLELCTLHPRLDRDLLLAAALLHDLGKTREFTYGAEIERSEEGRLLGHIELTLRLLAPRYPSSLPPSRRLALEHCIVAHHGPEALAGGRFASAEAVALYRCNALDAHLKGVFEHGP
ncbi:MAG TPA: HD domain-containing protein [Solirubrobacteraceae bacterium]|jgi:3'-5' exoribonuclease|nr:HD domain-containing protein [Solirubrobacteraceae bacterium]